MRDRLVAGHRADGSAKEGFFGEFIELGTYPCVPRRDVFGYGVAYMLRLFFPPRADSVAVWVD